MSQNNFIPRPDPLALPSANADAAVAVARARQCPTILGKSERLITHTIGTTLCFQRQRENYHKCHRCAYRGQPAEFAIDEVEAFPGFEPGALAERDQA